MLVVCRASDCFAESVTPGTITSCVGLSAFFLSSEDSEEIRSPKVSPLRMESGSGGALPCVGGGTLSSSSLELPRPDSARFGSGALRTSGNSVFAGSLLALSTNGIGTCVTKRATATAAARPRIRPTIMPNRVLPPDFDEGFLRFLAISYILSGAETPNSDKPLASTCLVA